MSVVMTDGVMVTSRVYTRWNAVYDESRTHGVGRGKIRRLYQRITYRHRLYFRPFNKSAMCMATLSTTLLKGILKTLYS